jgi:Putative polyhydroxyalkanoic acid system protein (PHA_gran_rgn)
MTKPLLVTLPHNLGKVEAIRRLKSGLANAASQFGPFLKVDEETWRGDQLSFRVTVLRQQMAGTIEVGEESVRLEVMLPWILATLAHRAQSLIQQKGTLLLEKK